MIGQAPRDFHGRRPGNRGGLEGRRRRFYTGAMKTRPAFIAAFILGAAAMGDLAAQPVAVAFLGTANSGGDARYDYLEPLISGLLLYDLSSTEGLALTDRAMLKDVLKEQELSLNLGKGDAVKLGGILGARWIAKAEYSVMGQEAAVNLTLVDVETSQSFVFADRGTDENIVHGIAEKAVKKLCGADAAFRSEQRQRSLLSLKDVKPGGVNLHCPLIDAQVFLDGEFVGYSAGNVKTPVKLENVDPGKHVLLVKLSGFGSVKLPEVKFVDWEKTVDVLPGKTVAVQADAMAFSEWYYRLIRLDEQSFLLKPDGAKEFATTYPFVDRRGASRPISVSFKAGLDAKGGRITGSLSIDGASAPLDIRCAPRKEAEAKVELGPIKASLSIDLHNPDRNEYRLRLERTDIEFGEWEE